MRNYFRFKIVYNGIIQNQSKAKQGLLSNGLILKKGMSVEVASKYMTNPIMTNPIMANRGDKVQEAFLRKYGLD